MNNFNKKIFELVKNKKDYYQYILGLNKKDFYNLKDNADVVIKGGCVDNIFGIKIVCIKGLKNSIMIYLGKDSGKDGFRHLPNPNFVGDLE